MVAESGFLIEPSLDGIPSGLELLHRSVKGFCEIYRAEKFGQFVVLKALKPQYREDPVYEALLRKEFEIGYGLNAPHICRTWHFRRLPELGNCIEMEWVDGVPLSERFAEEKPSEALLRKIAAELCDAVAYIHARQVIHRDIKPSNILITHSGDNVKLIDFGLADADDSAILKMPAGTQHYLAPEVLAGHDADMRTDIWAVGKVLSELTAGPRGPHARALRKACRENPDERFQHITELKQAFLQPSRRPWLYVAVVLIVAALGLIFALRQQPDQPVVQPQQEILSPSPTPRDDKDSFADARNDNSDAVDGKAKPQDASPVTPSGASPVIPSEASPVIPSEAKESVTPSEASPVIPSEAKESVTPSEGRRPESRVSPSTSGQPASTKKEATREDIDALFKEATDLFE